MPAMLNGPERTLNRARQLREDMSLPEVLLWRELRKWPAGLKFRRQHPAGDYIVDFFCQSAQLAIEIDGAVHDDSAQIRRDEAKRHWLRSQGVRVIRIRASSVLDNMHGVVDYIIGKAGLHLPLHHPSDGPPPPVGEIS